MPQSLRLPALLCCAWSAFTTFEPGCVGLGVGVVGGWAWFWGWACGRVGVVPWRGVDAPRIARWTLACSFATDPRGGRRAAPGPGASASPAAQQALRAIGDGVRRGARGLGGAGGLARRRFRSRQSFARRRERRPRSYGVGPANPPRPADR